MDIMEKLRYRLEYIFYKINSKKKPIVFSYYLSVVAIIKNEADYIAEWLEYHLLVGVRKFYIFDNDSKDNLVGVLKPYITAGIVEYHYIFGIRKQRYVYNHILEKARKETFWLAVIDCDEFIVPITTRTINELLVGFEEFSGVEINWVIYGSNGEKVKAEGLVMERFKSHSLPEFERNRVVKSIVNPRRVYNVHVHDCIYFKNNYSVNTNKERNKEYFLYRNGVFDKIRINHYFGKSYEEFLLKRNRGRASKIGLKPIEDFYKFDRNEIVNDPIMDKYIKIVYENIKKRYNVFENKL